MRRVVISSLLGISVAMTIPAAGYDIPPAGSTYYLQTSGPDAALAEGDWYTSDAAGAGSGSHFIEIFVPVEWPGTAIHVDLLSPDLNSGSTGADAIPRDEIRSSAETSTEFEIHGPFNAQDHMVDLIDPSQPASGTGMPGSLSSYAQDSVAVGTWVRHFTIPAPAGGMKYILRVSTQGDHDNGWAVRVGTDNNGDPNDAPPANSDNPDGIPGTNDELIAGILAASLQHNGPGNLVIDLFEHVEAEEDSIFLHNFDADGGATILYTDPFGIPRGTPVISGNAVWNGGTTDRGGDELINPLPGIWRIRTTINANNQFIQEGRIAESAFTPTPPEPRINMAMTGPATFVQPGDTYPYTVSYIAQPLPNPGRARNLVFRIFIPRDTTFEEGSIVFASGKMEGTDFTVDTNPPTDRIGQEIIITTFDDLPPDESDAFTLQVTIDPDAAFGTDLTAAGLVDYQDAYNFLYRASAAEATVLAVELNSLSARYNATTGNYELLWTTASEFENVGFHVFAATVSETGALVPGERLTTQLIPSEATGSQGASYRFVDPRPMGDPNAARIYFLQDVEVDGTETYNGPVSTLSRGQDTKVEDWMTLEY